MSCSSEKTGGRFVMVKAGEVTTSMRLVNRDKDGNFRYTEAVVDPYDRGLKCITYLDLHGRKEGYWAKTPDALVEVEVQ